MLCREKGEGVEWRGGGGGGGGEQDICWYLEEGERDSCCRDGTASTFDAAQPDKAARIRLKQIIHMAAGTDMSRSCAVDTTKCIEGCASVNPRYWVLLSLLAEITGIRISDCGVDLMHFLLRNPFKTKGGMAAGTGRYGWIGALRRPVPYLATA